MNNPLLPYGIENRISEEGEEYQTFRAFLKGRNEVPPVRTISTGTTIIQLNRAGDKLFLDLSSEI